LTRYVLSRTGSSFLVLLSASVVLFTVIRLIPGDPVTILLGSANIYDPELVARTRIAYGLDQPLPIQYLAWISHILQGDFGRSLVTSEPVAAIVARRLGPSLLLGLGASTLGVFLGLAWGIAAGYVGGTARTVLRALPMVALVVPTFSVGLLLVFVFAVQLGLLPASGLASPLEGDTPSVGSALAHLILPSLALSMVPASLIARLTYATVDEVEQEEFIRTARALGVRPLRIAIQHSLPNVLLPIITTGGLLVSALITNAVLIETVFSWPGIGTMMISAVQQRDYTVVQAGILVVATVYVISSLAVDALYLLADPRVRTPATE
jgi:ABC-type dipeptide/oligopeptide/nickel transport system permease component